MVMQSDQNYFENYFSIIYLSFGSPSIVLFSRRGRIVSWCII